MRCATSPASPSVPAKAATRATRLHPRLLGAERHLPRRGARSRLVYARHLRDRCGRSLQGTGLRAVRPRLDRRRDQPDQQDAVGAQLRRRTLTANTGPGYRATVDANGKVSDNLWGRVVAMGQMYDIAGRDHIEQNRYGIDPSLMYKPSDQTKVTARLHLSARQQHSRLRHPVPVASWGVPRSVAPVTARQLVRHPERTDAGHRDRHRPDRDGEDRTQVQQRRQGHQHHALEHVDRLQRNVFPEPNATIPPPPNLNAIVDAEPRAGPRHQHAVRQSDRRAHEIHHRIARSQDDARLRYHAGDRATSCATTSPAWRRPTSSIRIRGAAAASPRRRPRAR